MIISVYIYIYRERERYGICDYMMSHVCLLMVTLLTDDTCLSVDDVLAIANIVCTCHD